MPFTEHQNPDGKFKAGNNANPNGANGQRGGFVTWNKRVDQLDEKYDTTEKLMALFERGADGKMFPSAELMSMHPRDFAILMQSLGAIIGDDKVRERETFWDRREGKARLPLSHEGGVEIEMKGSIDVAGARVLGILEQAAIAKSESGLGTTELDRASST